MGLWLLVHAYAPPDRRARADGKDLSPADLRGKIAIADFRTS
jgi:hypothetical protein